MSFIVEKLRRREATRVCIESRSEGFIPRSPTGEHDMGIVSPARVTRRTKDTDLSANKKNRQFRWHHGNVSQRNINQHDREAREHAAEEGWN